MPVASASALRKATISIGSPVGLQLNSVLPSRLRFWAMTALAASRMCPVQRKFSSSLICAAPGKSCVKRRIHWGSALR